MSKLLNEQLSQSNTTHKTQSIGVSFCGSSSLEALMAGENGRAAVQQLLREDAFVSALERLSHLSGSGDAIIQATQTIIESWRLATLVAHACDTPNGSGDVLGSLTDRWGLTTPTKDASGNVTGHEFNPKITLSFNQSTVTTKNTRMAPTTLMIGGTLHIAADIIQLLDGTQIAADNIQLHARKLLEIRAAQHTTTTSCHQQGGSVSFRANGDFAGASAYESKHHSETVHYQNTCLKARNLLSILNEGKTIIQGAELTGVDVMIKTTELLFESLQDTHHASGHSNGVCIDPEGNGGVQSAKESAHKAWVNHPSFINAERSLDLFVDHLSQNGSVLSADQRLRVQGLNQEAPLQWNHSDIQDSESSSSKAISLSSNGQNDSFPLTGFAQFKKSHKQGVTRATAAAPNTVGAIPAVINRDVHQAQEVLSTKKSNIGVPIVCPNVPKIKEDAASMSKVLTVLEATYPSTAQEQKPLESSVKKDSSKPKTPAKAKQKKDDAVSTSKGDEAPSKLELWLANKLKRKLRLQGEAIDETLILITIRETLEKQSVASKDNLILAMQDSEREKQLLQEATNNGARLATIPLAIGELLILFMGACGLTYLQNQRMHDSNPNNLGFPAEQEYEWDRENGTNIFPEHVREDDTTGYEPGNVHGSGLGNDMPGFMPMFDNKPNIIEKNNHKSKGNDDRPNKPDPDKQYHQKPKGPLPGFPEAKPRDGMTPNGMGGTRGRWLLPSGEILEWDGQHGELEKYNETGKKHLGAFDPNTGAQLKPARPERNIRRFVN